MKEAATIQQLKLEKYEEALQGKVEPIDTETLDGRVNFLVSVLEEYKKQLEDIEDEESSFTSEKPPNDSY